jgi:predicted CoA-binding protein
MEAKMAHPLEDVIRNAEPYVFICDSSQERFSGMSYANATKKGHKVYYYDLGGLTESRGPVKGGKVYADPTEIPLDRTDLCVIWVKPRKAREAVEEAQKLGAKRIWFSFDTGHRDAVARAQELGMVVVENGRCPVYYTKGQIPVCAAHTFWVKLNGSYGKPPRAEARV